MLAEMWIFSSPSTATWRRSALTSSSATIAACAASAWEQHAELVAAQPRQHVGLAHALRERPATLFRRSSPGLVAEAVVDVLEVVEVDQEQRRRRRRSGLPVDVLSQLLLEAAPVDEAGQEIVIDEIREVRLELLPRGDVLHLGDEIQRRVVVVPDQRDASPAPRCSGPSRGGSASRSDSS